MLYIGADCNKFPKSAELGELLRLLRAFLSTYIESPTGGTIKR